MKSVSSTFNKSDSVLSVTLYSSKLTKEGEMIGKVTRNTVTLENMIAAIIEENRGLDPYMVQHSAILLQQQILKMLQLGKCVNILDLGTMYIGLNGTIKGERPDASDIPDFKIRFTPSALSNEALKSLQVDKIVVADSSPQISIITNTWTNNQNTVSAGKLCRITGSRLKLGGEICCLCFLNLNEDGSINSELDPYVVDLDKVTKNTAGMLEFYVPNELSSDKKYIISIASSYLSKTQSRKTPVTTLSNAVSVEA